MAAAVTTTIATTATHDHHDDGGADDHDILPVLDNDTRGLQLIATMAGKPLPDWAGESLSNLPTGSLPPAPSHTHVITPDSIGSFFFGFSSIG